MSICSHRSVVRAPNSIQFVHHIPGRLRVRVVPVRDNVRAACLVENRLRKHHGVRSAEANVTTGSVVVRYDAAQTSPQRIIALLDEHSAHLPVVRTGPPPPPNRDELVARIAPWLIKYLLETAIERSLMLLLAAIF